MVLEDACLEVRPSENGVERERMMARLDKTIRQGSTPFLKMKLTTGTVRTPSSEIK